MSDAWTVVHEGPADRTPTGIAAWRNARRPSVAEVAGVAARLSRITLPLASFDWDKLRVNVFALVAPELVKWR
jgi:hypothetical protein